MVPPSTTQWAHLGVSAEGLHRPHMAAAVSSPGAKLRTAIPFTTTAHPQAPAGLLGSEPPAVLLCGHLLVSETQFCKSLAEGLA